MKITGIKQQIKNAERASIFVEGKYTFSLHLNELIEEKLKIGQELQEEDIKRLKKLSEDGKLRARTLEWVLVRPRSVRECRDYLYRKKADPDFSESLMKDFKKRGYLDDVVFAKWLIDMRRRGGKSDRAIQNELMKKGVAREVMHEAMPKDEEDERMRLHAVYEKKQRLTRYKNDPVKFKQFLLRQGFSYEDIKQLFTPED